MLSISIILDLILQIKIVHIVLEDQIESIDRIAFEMRVPNDVCSHQVIFLGNVAIICFDRVEAYESFGLVWQMIA